MLRELSSVEVAEYMALDRLDGPMGELRADQRAALICSTIANANRGKKQRAVGMDNFMMYGRREKLFHVKQVSDSKGLSAALRAAFAPTRKD